MSFDGFYTDSWRWDRQGKHALFWDRPCPALNDLSGRQDVILKKGH